MIIVMIIIRIQQLICIRLFWYIIAVTIKRRIVFLANLPTPVRWKKR